MRREIYQWMNAFAIIAIALLVCSLQTVILKLPIFRWIGIDLILLIVAYLGLKRGIFLGAILTALVGHIAELHSGSPRGMIMSCYFVVFGATLLSREFFIMESPFSIVILGVFSGLAWKIAFLILSYKADMLSNVWLTILFYMPTFLVAQGLLTRPMFSLLHKLDELMGVGEHSEFHGAY
jgi:hypothetical protein